LWTVIYNTTAFKQIISSIKSPLTDYAQSAAVKRAEVHGVCRLKLDLFKYLTFFLIDR